MPKNKALFFDRDGVINKDVGHVWEQEKIEFMPGVFDFCRHAKALGYLIIVVTNQSGIARGLFGKPEVYELMRWMGERFMAENCPWTAYYFCPHHPEFGNARYKQECECRKPKPGMILQAAKEWDIDLTESILIGDNDRDIEAGRAAGVGRNELFSGAWPEI